MIEYKKELIKKLEICVLEMEDEEIIDIAEEYIKNKFDIYDGVVNGLISGMKKACELYDEEEYFIADILLCSDALNEGLEVFKPYLKDDFKGRKGKIIIGVVEGDTHDIGKNLVKIMLETSGFEVIDLGRDVTADEFIEKVLEEKPEILCLSALMTTTMLEMENVINKLKENNIRENIKVMVGGGPVTEDFARKIGADAYSGNAMDAVIVANSLIN